MFTPKGPPNFVPGTSFIGTIVAPRLNTVTTLTVSLRKMPLKFLDCPVIVRTVVFLLNMYSSHPFHVFKIITYDPKILKMYIYTLSFSYCFDFVVATFFTSLFP